jgi:hypothetical protein
LKEGISTEEHVVHHVADAARCMPRRVKHPELLASYLDYIAIGDLLVDGARPMHHAQEGLFIPRSHQARVKIVTYHPRPKGLPEIARGIGVIQVPMGQEDRFGTQVERSELASDALRLVARVNHHTVACGVALDEVAVPLEQPDDQARNLRVGAHRPTNGKV